MKKIVALLLAVLMLVPMFGMQTAALAAEKETGKAYSTVQATGVKATKTITVTGVSKNSKKAVDCTLYVGQTLKLKTDSSKTVTWTSSDESVAKITGKGKVVGQKAGTAVLTGTDGKKKYNVSLSVNAVLKASSKNVSTTVGATKTVKMTFTKTGHLTYSVANKAVVDAAWADDWENNGTTIKLYLTGLKKGSTTVTITNSVTSDKVKIKVTVKAAKAKAKYRALVIGEQTFVQTDGYRYWKDTCTRNTGDMNNMAAMLKKVKGPNGSKYTSVVKKKNLSYNGVKNAIKSTFKSTKDTDVSLFFIASHGNSNGDGELQMAFTGNINSYSDVEDYLYSSTSFLPLDTLASWLNSYVKGKVIVILESCGAGSAIFYSTDRENGVPKLIPADGQPELIQKVSSNGKDNTASFVSAAVQAFASRDSGVVESNSTGDMRTPKFYVLAASRHMEMSWGTENGPYNYFTKWLIDGVGSSSYSPADSNGNKRITLTELFSYIKQVGDNKPFNTDDGTFYQHVQRYPASSQYELFRW
jgi:hypothetical protein